jgi:hypothetical protein
VAVLGGEQVAGQDAGDSSTSESEKPEVWAQLPSRASDGLPLWPDSSPAKAIGPAITTTASSWNGNWAVSLISSVRVAVAIRPAAAERVIP